MDPRHHLDDSTLVSFAAGALSEPLRVVTVCHLQHCERCSERALEAELVGGLMLDAVDKAAAISDGGEVPPAVLAALDAKDERVDDARQPDAEAPCNEALPEPLRQRLDADYDALPWKPMTPGIQQVRIDVGEGNLRLFRIAPGACMPIHSHHGSELTLVLKGSYSDEIGRFCSGDIADLDPDVEHQPIADRDQDCICVIATDAPLKFRGILPRLFQPFVGL